MERVLLENKFELTPLFFIQHNNQKVNLGIMTKIIWWIKLLWYICMVAFTGTCMFVTITYESHQFWRLTAMSAVISIMPLVSLLLKPRLAYQTLKENAGQTKLLDTIQFGESYINYTRVDTTTKYTYDQIKYLVEDESYVYLYLDTPAFLCVYKNAFTIGNLEEFRRFIRMKTAESNSLWTEKELSLQILKKNALWIIIIIITQIVIIQKIIQYLSFLL